MSYFIDSDSDSSLPHLQPFPFLLSAILSIFSHIDLILTLDPSYIVFYSVNGGIPTKFVKDVTLRLPKLQKPKIITLIILKSTSSRVPLPQTKDAPQLSDLTREEAIKNVKGIRTR